MTCMLVIALLTVGDPNRLTGGYLYQRRMAEEAPQHQARIEFVSLPERAFPLAIVDAPAALRRATFLRANALVLDSIAAAYLGPWLAVREVATPLVGMLHQAPGGMEHGPIRTAAQRALDHLAYRRACRLLVSSQSLADEVVAGGVPRERVQVIPPGRDLATSRSISVDASLSDHLRHERRAAILCVGNWVERKGIHCLLDALAELAPDAATLHLVGDDRADPRYSGRLRARLARPDLAGRVVVHGSLPPDRVAALYQAADIFALPSFQEPYGMAYAEAMSAGLPIVGWCAGNLPYLVKDGHEGLIVTPGDVDGLARALACLADDEGLRRRLGEAARRRALELPTWEESARLFFEAIRHVVEPSVGRE